MCSFTCVGYDYPIHGTDSLKSHPKDYVCAILNKADCEICTCSYNSFYRPVLYILFVVLIATGELTKTRCLL